MKRTLSFLASLVLAMSPLSASAMSVGGGDQFLVPAEITINDDVYAGGGTVILNGTINGDAYLGGGTVMVNGPVKQDLTVAGGTITIDGNVDDDIRGAGGTITIASHVKGDVIIGGGTVIISKNTVIEHDLVVGAGSLVLEGTVKGNVRLGGGSIVLNGTIQGETQIEADTVKIGSNARIAKPISYRATREAYVDQGAQVNGLEFSKRDMPTGATDEQRAAAKGGLAGLLVMIALLKLFGLLVASVVMVSCFKTYSTKLVDRALSKPGNSLLNGFATLVLTPIIVILLFVTLIGAPLGGLLAIGYGFLVAMAKIYAGVVFGAWLWQLSTKNKPRALDWKTALIGTFLLFFICLIPFIGWIVGLLAFVAALGGIYSITEEKIKTMR